MARCHLTRPFKSRHNRVLVAILLAVVLAGCGDQTPDRADTPADDAARTAGPVMFVAIDIDYEHAPGSLPPGSHTIELINDGALPHTVTIEELDDRDVVEASGGGTATGEVELEPGSYTYYCSVPGHREAGMEGTLEVAEEAS